MRSENTAPLMVQLLQSESLRYPIPIYEKLLKSKCKKTDSTKLKRGQPLMLGSINEKVKNFLLILRRKGGVVNSVIAIAAAQALIQKSSGENLKCIDIVSSSWTQSLFEEWVLSDECALQTSQKSLIKL